MMALFFTSVSQLYEYYNIYNYQHCVCLNSGDTSIDTREHTSTNNYYLKGATV